MYSANSRTVSTFVILESMLISDRRTQQPTRHLPVQDNPNIDHTSLLPCLGKVQLALGRWVWGRGLRVPIQPLLQLQVSALVVTPLKMVCGRLELGRMAQ